jgi:competence protein ComEA
MSKKTVSGSLSLIFLRRSFSMNPRTLRPLLVASLVLASCAAYAADVTAPAGGGKKVNINQASVEQIAQLPRVGAKAAQRIVDFRKARGPFARIEDVMEVKGFGEKRFEQLKPYLAVSGATTLDTKVSSAGSRGGAKAAKAPKKATSGKKASATSASVPVGKER